MPLALKELTGDRLIPVPISTGPPRDFLLCLYPQKSVFDRPKANVPGEVCEAANLSCR